MYNPAYSKNENTDLALDLIEEYSFGLLQSVHNQKIESSYLPFQVIKEENQIYLITHLAKANQHWRFMQNEVQISFCGPNEYISPTLYQNKINVPTWSYAVVQAFGSVEKIEDQAGLHQLLHQTVKYFEQKNQTSWQYDLPAEMQKKMQAAIVGLKIKVTQLDSKFKLNQNRDKADYIAVLEHFKASTQASHQEIYKWMLKSNRIES